MKVKTVFIVILPILFFGGAWLLAAQRFSPPQSVGSTPRADERSDAEIAVSLVSASGSVERIERLSDRLFWIGQKEIVDSDEATYQEVVRSWSINLDRRTATLLEELTFGYPGASVSLTDAGGGDVFAVLWSSGWEASYREHRAYVDRGTGELVFSFDSSDGRELRVRNGREQARIALDPIGGCDGASHAIVSGIRIEEDIVLLTEPREVACVHNDMTGESFYPPFPSVDLTNDFRASIVLPWGGSFTIPADALTAERAVFAE